jgi:hypothetical protein
MNLTKDFFLGGNATFTVENGKGTHYTFKVRKPKSDSPYFVSLMTGPDNENSFTYMGLLVERPIIEQVTGPNGGIATKDTGRKYPTVKLTGKSKYTIDSQPVKVAQWAFNVVWNQKTLPVGYQIRHEGRCGCCGRKLTEPTSLDCGIGPECRKRYGLA